MSTPFRAAIFTRLISGLLISLVNTIVVGWAVAQSGPDLSGPTGSKKDPVVEFISIPAFDGVCRAYTDPLDANLVTAFLEIYRQAGLDVASSDNWRVTFAKGNMVTADADGAWTKGVSDWTVCLPRNSFPPGPPAAPYQQLTLAETDGARIACPDATDTDGCADALQQWLLSKNQLITGLPMQETTPTGQVTLTVPIPTAKK